LFEGRKEGLVRKALVCCRLGNAEINYLRHRYSVMVGHKNVGRFDVPMDDAFLMRVLNGLAHVDEKLLSLLGVESLLVTETGYGNSLDQLHHEIRPARIGGAGSQNFP
jgi:hypothetical protein